MEFSFDKELAAASTGFNANVAGVSGADDGTMNAPSALQAPTGQPVSSSIAPAQDVNAQRPLYQVQLVCNHKMKQNGLSESSPDMLLNLILSNAKPVQQNV